MTSRLTLPTLSLLLVLPIVVAVGASPSVTLLHTSAAATATGTHTAGSTPAATTTAEPSTPQAGSALPTAGPGVSTSSAAPDWVGLPVRTYANLKKKVLGDPVNIAFEGTQAGILAAFAKIGWVQADPLSPRNDIHLAEATIKHGNYPKAPVSNLYLFGRAEDLAVERELRSVYSRDHARFWDTTRHDRKNNLDLFVGDASRDIAIKVLRTKAGLPRGTTHKIDGNLDAERDRIVGAMRQAGVVSAVVMEPGMGRVTNGVNGGGDRFYTDGKVAVIVLKNGS